jgi:RimJ/RimL family protein N-acetyltransferase
MEDAPEAFATYASDPVATRYLSWKAHTEIEPLREFIKTQEEVWRTGTGHHAWVLRLNATGELAGSIGLSLHAHSVLFGYVLGQNYWRQGLMAEALAALVEWSLAQPGIRRAWAYCDVQNAASAHVMEKAGMQREGILRRWHTCPTIGPEPRDCIVCAKVN